MGSLEKFCLKWNDFQSNISTSFQDLRKEQNFSDVTLTCDGNTRIEAHRVILAGSSKFFSKVLKQQQHPHPLLYMRGMTAGQLSAVVDFIYHGEANIDQEDLESFLAVAEELELTGLNKTESTHQEQERSEYEPSKHTQRTNHYFNKQEHAGLTQNDSKSNTCQAWQPENDINTSVVNADAYAVNTHTNNKELDATLNTMMAKNTDGKWECNICGKSDKSRSHMREHIEANHIDGVSHPCSQCVKSFRCRSSLRLHVFKLHKIK
jgi:hypothetical protein